MAWENLESDLAELFATAVETWKCQGRPQPADLRHRSHALARGSCLGREYLSLQVNLRWDGEALLVPVTVTQRGRPARHHALRWGWRSLGWMEDTSWLPEGFRGRLERSLRRLCIRYSDRGSTSRSASSTARLRGRSSQDARSLALGK